MTDPAAPPSIPPRPRPTSPTGRTATSSSGRDAAARAGVESPVESSTNGAASSNGASSNGASSNGTSSNGTSSTTAGHNAGGSSASGASAPVPPPPGASSVSLERTEPEPPSPLMVAVDTATSWLKKAAGATGAAISSAARPRNGEPAMSTTSAAGAANAAPPTVKPGSAVPPAGATPAMHPNAPRTVTGPPSGATPRPTTGRIPTVGSGPRRVRLSISRVDPWSVMKLAFLLSVAFGVMVVVAVAVVWYTLNKLHVFGDINNLVTQIVGSNQYDLLQYVAFKRVISGATLIAVVDIFLLTALATIGAFLYNIVAALVGGLHVTMTDE